jgi:hypothetical protein
MLDPRDLQEMLDQQVSRDPQDRPARRVPLERLGRLALMGPRVPPELQAIPVPKVRKVR